MPDGDVSFRGNMPRQTLGTLKQKHKRIGRDPISVMLASHENRHARCDRAEPPDTDRITFTYVSQWDVGPAIGPISNLIRSILFIEFREIGDVPDRKSVVLGKECSSRGCV